MKTILFTILTIVLILTQAEAASLKEIRESSQEIRLLNLLNSLYLTPEQSQFILIRARRLGDLKPEPKGEYLEILEKVKEDLKKDNFVTDQNREDFHRIKKGIEENIKGYREMARQYAEEVKTQLTPIQQQVIEDYKPCIIPPKGPSRIGQSGEAHGPQKKLERIYNMPPELYNEHRDELAEKVTEKWGKQSEEDLSSDIVEFFNKIRVLDEIEFEANKENLAKEFKELFPHRKIDLVVKIQKFLLNPEVIPLLERKI